MKQNKGLIEEGFNILTNSGHCPDSVSKYLLDKLDRIEKDKMLDDMLEKLDEKLKKYNVRILAIVCWDNKKHRIFKRHTKLKIRKENNYDDK